MLGRLSLFGVTLLGIGLSGQPAHAAEAIDFLDTRPVVIDLDDAEPRQRWRVRLIDLQQSTSEVSLHVVFAPAGVITVEDSTVRSSGSGEIVEFVIELDRKLEGTGELVAVSGGGVAARRPISTSFAPGDASLTVDTLQFAGWRIAPFLDLVRIPEVRIPDAPGLVSTDRPLRVGVLTSASGDVAELVRIGDRFAVDGVEAVGEYTGGTDLLPGRDAGDVEATVRVRDLPAWPLLVLVGGMTIANVLDRYQRRQRPQRLHEWRLARLRERARESQSLTGGRLRITAAREAPAQLLLDHLIDDARAGFHPHLTDAERASWEPGGDEYERLMATVRDFRLQCMSFRSLLEERDSLIRSADQEDQTRISNALRASAVAHALRERSITSPADLTDAEQDLTQGRAHLQQVKAIYDLLRKLRRVDSADVRGAAESLLEKLFAHPPDLAELEVESRELLDTWSQRPSLPKRPTGPWILEEQEPAGPVAGHGPPAAAPPARGAPLRRALIATAGVVAALSVGIVVVSTLMLTEGAPPGTNGEAVPTQTTPAPTPTVPLPDAPVAAPTAGLVLDGSRADTPSIGQTVWFGVITPVLVLAAGAALWWLVSRWWRRRLQPHADELDPSKIDHEYRREERRYSILAGILVVLSGMSLLYVGNPEFGTAGDYLAVALWGAAVGEGVQLARRLWPSLPVPGSAP
ncbi:MAG TPA: hypothetical protein VFZ85_04000 [Jiangellaceae bacterium]